MLKIRLQRVGRKHIPTFRVVLTDSRNSTKSGRFLEILGSYDSRKDDSKIVDAERVKYWISKGAQLSGTLHNFFVHTKIIEGKKINVLPK
ncbi:MAG: 30S ribosomal protein S16, partial [bacterium]|nr:30S ribosomal protein S16 [bacterium]